MAGSHEDKWNESAQAKRAPTALAEAASSGELSADLEAHLTGCPRCFGLYAELARVRHLDLSGLPSASSEYLELGYSLASLSESTRRTPRSSRRGLSRPGAKWLVGPTLAAAALAFVLVVRAPQSATDLDPSELSAVQAVIDRASHQGLVLLDSRLLDSSVHDEHPATSRVFRSASSPEVDVPLAKAIENLIEHFEGHDFDADAATWLVSTFLATGQVRNARAYLDEARLHHPAHEQWAGLEAVLLVRENRGPEAEILLRNSLADDPGDLRAKLNLALLLDRRGPGEDRSEARSLAEAVLHSAPGTQWSQRAAEILR